MMSRNNRPRTAALWLFLAYQCITVDSFAGLQPCLRVPLKRTRPSPDDSTSALFVRGGGDAANKNKESSSSYLQDYSAGASSLFGNLRIPAALFAGASLGAAFAMPLQPGEGLKLGLVKRVYSLLMMASLSAQIVTIIVSTLAMGTLACHKSEPTFSLPDLLQQDYDLEWVTARINFLGGVLMFSVACGIRAWVTIGCPVFAKASLGVITSATLLSFSFVARVDALEGGGIWKLPQRFLKLLLTRARKDPLFALAFVSYAFTWCYMGYKSPHVYRYLAAGN